MDTNTLMTATSATSPGAAGMQTAGYPAIPLGGRLAPVPSVHGSGLPIAGTSFVRRDDATGLSPRGAPV